MTRPKITAVILTRNEEEMLSSCLDSLSFVDQILIIDNGSTDTTVELAKEKGATVISFSLNDFAKRRELAMTKVKSGYLLYVDADERVSSELQSEIKRAVEAGRFSAYRIPRRNYYLGKHPWPNVEYLERLFKRTALKGWRGEVHETPEIEGEVGQLENPLLHYTHRDFSSMVEKTNQWSEIEAKLRFEALHPPVSWWRFPRVMLQAFFDSYIKQRGWKVGTVGILESMYQAFSIFITYAKLWEMQQDEKKKRS